MGFFKSSQPVPAPAPTPAPVAEPIVVEEKKDWLGRKKTLTKRDPLVSPTSPRHNNLQPTSPTGVSPMAHLTQINDRLSAARAMVVEAERAEVRAVEALEAARRAHRDAVNHVKALEDEARQQSHLADEHLKQAEREKKQATAALGEASALSKRTDKIGRA